MKKISVVIPMFNSFGLMKRNLEILEKMPAGSVEVIAVDDCSPDGSFDAARAYAQQSSLEMKVLQNEVNAGPGVARNRGIDAATGEYITFVDSDDYLDDAFYSKISALLEQDIDCIIFDYTVVSETGEALSIGGSIGAAHVQPGFLDPKFAFVYTYGSTWGKVYKRSIIEQHHIRYGAFYRSEDMPFTKQALAECSCIYYLNEALYHYVQVATSLMHNPKLNDERNCQRAFQMLSRNLSDAGLDGELLSVELREVLNNSVLIMAGRGCTRKEIVSYIRRSYRREHICSPYFRGYPLYVRVTARLAYGRCIFALRLIERRRSRKKC